MQKDNRERIGGETVKSQDQRKLAAVRSRLLEHVRETRGLPSGPVQLDVKAISQLSNAPIIEHVEAIVTTKVLDISVLSPNHSVVGLSLRQKRLEGIEAKKAA